MEVVNKVTVPPTTYPVTVDEVKNHAGISTSFDDALIGNVYIPAAVEYVESMLKRQLLTATARLTLSRFPYGRGIIEIPIPPLISITSITYVDSAGATQTVSSADYQVDTETEPGRVAPARGDSWPEPDSETLNAVQVTYQCGYGAAISVPTHIKLGIMVLCAHWYKHKEIDVTGAIPNPVKHSLDAILAKERIEPPNYEDC